MLMSVRGNENNKWKRNAKKTKTEINKREGVTEAIVKGWELNDFVVRLSFFKASLIFKSNLELALSIIWKQRELYESKHVAVECRCLKIWDLLSFLICSSILVLKWQQVSPI